MYMKKLKCPICGKIVISHSANPNIQNHILAKARDEAFKKMLDLYKYHTKNFEDVSRMVMLRNMPHFQWLKKRSRIKTKIKS